MLIPLPAMDVLFDSIVWTPNFPQQKNRSEFTSRSQVMGTPGAEEWRAEAATLPPANVDEDRAWRAFVIACRGSENTFRLPALPLPQYVGPQPTVTAAVAGNRAVTVSSAVAIRLGMYASVKQTDGHERLVVVVGIAGTTIHFEPFLTANPTIGQTFEIANPGSLVRFADSRQRLPIRGEAVRLLAEEAL